MKNKLGFISLVLAIAMLLVACGGTTVTTEAPTAEPTEAPTAEPTEAPTTESTETATETESAVASEVVYLFDPAFMKSMGEEMGISSAVKADEDHRNMPYVSYSAPGSDEKMVYLIHKNRTVKEIAGSRYFAMLYCENGFKDDIELWVSNTTDAGQGASLVLSAVQGKWSLLLFDMSRSATAGSYDPTAAVKTLRLDIFNGGCTRDAEDSLDIAYAGFFADAEAAETYYESFVEKYALNVDNGSADETETTPEELFPGAAHLFDPAFMKSMGEEMGISSTVKEDEANKNMPYVSYVAAGSDEKMVYLIHKNRNLKEIPGGQYFAMLYRQVGFKDDIELWVSNTTDAAQGAYMTLSTTENEWKLLVFDMKKAKNNAKYDTSAAVKTLRLDIFNGGCTRDAGDSLDIAYAGFFADAAAVNAYYKDFIADYGLTPDPALEDLTARPGLPLAPGTSTGAVQTPPVVTLFDPIFLKYMGQAMGLSASIKSDEIYNGMRYAGYTSAGSSEQMVFLVHKNREVKQVPGGPVFAILYRQVGFNDNIEVWVSNTTDASQGAKLSLPAVTGRWRLLVFDMSKAENSGNYDPTAPVLTLRLDVFNGGSTRDATDSLDIAFAGFFADAAAAEAHYQEFMADYAPAVEPEPDTEPETESEPETETEAESTEAIYQFKPAFLKDMGEMMGVSSPIKNDTAHNDMPYVSYTKTVAAAASVQIYLIHKNRDVKEIPGGRYFAMLYRAVGFTGNIGISASNTTSKDAGATLTLPTVQNEWQLLVFDMSTAANSANYDPAQTVKTLYLDAAGVGVGQSLDIAYAGIFANTADVNAYCERFTAAYGLVIETETETETDPYHLFEPAYLKSMGDEMGISTSVKQDTALNNMPYASYTSAGSSEQQVYLVFKSRPITEVVGSRYFAVLYRQVGFTDDLELWVSNTQAAGGGANLAMATVQDQWKLLIFDMSTATNSSNYDATAPVLTLRLDVFNGGSARDATDSVDIAYAGFFADETAAQSYYQAFMAGYTPAT